MPEHNEFELRIVESTKPLPSVKLPQPLARKAGLVQTPHAALVALRATKGGESAIERIRGLESPGTWSEVAYFTACETRGAAVAGVYLGLGLISLPKVPVFSPGSSGVSPPFS